MSTALFCPRTSVVDVMLTGRRPRSQRGPVLLKCHVGRRNGHVDPWWPERLERAFSCHSCSRAVRQILSEKGKRTQRLIDWRSFLQNFALHITAVSRGLICLQLRLIFFFPELPFILFVFLSALSHQHAGCLLFSSVFAPLKRQF